MFLPAGLGAAPVRFIVLTVLVWWEAAVVSGLVIAAGLTTLLVVPVVFWVWRLSKSGLVAWLPFLVQLPMSLVLNLTVKSWLSSAIIAFPAPLLLTLVLLLFVAPFTEEAVKLAGLPFGLRHSPFRKDAASPLGTGTPRRLRATGMMSGFGFGVGEIWALALLVLLYQPELAGYPWFWYQGFIIERFEVVFVHGFLALVSYWGYWRLLPVSYLAAVGLHAVLNAPVFWLELGLVSVQVVSLYVTLFSLGAFFTLVIVMTTPEHRKSRSGQLASAGEPIPAEEVAR
jgi:hypothetical protein